MTNEAKALVEHMRETIREWERDEPRDDWWLHQHDHAAAADLIETQAREIERLRLNVEAQEALQVSAYHAGLRAGWNFCVDDNHEGQQAAMASIDHIKELRRIREARAALGESHD